MIDRFHSLREDDRGVSPVIGVILMVAITVILAAVIGTFVIGLGDNIEDAPQAQLVIDAVDNESVSIEHNGGDSINGESLVLVVDGSTTEFEFEGEFSVGNSEEVNLTDSETVGDDNTVEEGSTVEIDIIHEPSDSILRSVTVNLE